MARLFVCCLAGIVAVTPSSVVASPTATSAPVVRFSLDQPGDVSTCTTEALLRTAVTLHLGRDPFRDDAQDLVHVTLRREPAELGGRLRATIERHDSGGQSRGGRELDGAAEDCAELVAALALSIAIAIDPLAWARGPEPTVAVTVSDPRRKSASQTLGWFAVGGVGTLGAEPAPSVGLTLQLGAGRGALRIAIEGRADRHGTRSLDPGEIRVSSMFALALACVALAGPHLCAIGGVERLRGEGRGLSVPRTATSVGAVGGARFAWPLRTDFLTIVSHLDILGRAGETTFEVDGIEVERSSRVHLAAGVSFELRFF